MKRILIILAIFCGLSIAYSQLPLVNSRSLHTDDSYYWPLPDTIVSPEPQYDRNVREFIFLEDTVQYPDTVHMRIVEK